MQGLSTAPRLCSRLCACKGCQRRLALDARQRAVRGPCPRRRGGGRDGGRAGTCLQWGAGNDLPGNPPETAGELPRNSPGILKEFLRNSRALHQESFRTPRCIPKGGVLPRNHQKPKSFQEIAQGIPQGFLGIGHESRGDPPQEFPRNFPRDSTGIPQKPPRLQVPGGGVSGVSDWEGRLGGGLWRPPAPDAAAAVVLRSEPRGGPRSGRLESVPGVEPMELPHLDQNHSEALTL
eukprot:gene12132-biopygen6437